MARFTPLFKDRRGRERSREEEGCSHRRKPWYPEPPSTLWSSTFRNAASDTEPPVGT